MYDGLPELIELFTGLFLVVAPHEAALLLALNLFLGLETRLQSFLQQFANFLSQMIDYLLDLGIGRECAAGDLLCDLPLPHLHVLAPKQ